MKGIVAFLAIIQVQTHIPSATENYLRSGYKLFRFHVLILPDLAQLRNTPRCGGLRRILAWISLVNAYLEGVGEIFFLPV